MPRNYLIVDRRILPDTYDKIIEARALLNTRRVKDVSEACKVAGISRSNYYKLKDYVFAPEEEKTIRKAVITMMLDHKHGVLSEVLHHISAVQANILTLTQNYPIQGIANIVVMVDIADLMVPLQTLLDELNGLDSVDGVQLLSVE